MTATRSHCDMTATRSPCDLTATRSPCDMTALSPTPVRRGLSTSLLRALLGAVGALIAAHLVLPDRPATLCPLRALTGIPCPICGSTTAAVRLGHFDLSGALRANPFTIVAALALVIAPAVTAMRRSRGFLPPTPPVRRLLAAVCVAVAALSEIWQLFRFDII